MTRWIGAARLIATLTLSVSTAIPPIAAAKVAMRKAITSGATDVSARHYERHQHYVYHPYYPYRYGRPYYYSPGPFFPFPESPGWDGW